MMMDGDNIDCVVHSGSGRAPFKIFFRVPPQLQGLQLPSCTIMFNRPEKARRSLCAARVA